MELSYKLSLAGQKNNINQLPYPCFLGETHLWIYFHVPAMYSALLASQSQFPVEEI